MTTDLVYSNNELIEHSLGENQKYFLVARNVLPENAEKVWTYIEALMAKQQMVCKDEALLATVNSIKKLPYNFFETSEIQGEEIMTGSISIHVYTYVIKVTTHVDDYISVLKQCKDCLISDLDLIILCPCDKEISSLRKINTERKVITVNDFELALRGKNPEFPMEDVHWGKAVVFRNLDFSEVDIEIKQLDITVPVIFKGITFFKNLQFSNCTFSYPIHIENLSAECFSLNNCINPDFCFYETTITNWLSLIGNKNVRLTLHNGKSVYNTFENNEGLSLSLNLLHLIENAGMSGNKSFTLALSNTVIEYIHIRNCTLKNFIIHSIDSILTDLSNIHILDCSVDIFRLRSAMINSLTIYNTIINNEFSIYGNSAYSEQYYKDCIIIGELTISETKFNKIESSINNAKINSIKFNNISAANINIGQNISSSFIEFSGSYYENTVITLLGGTNIRVSFSEYYAQALINLQNLTYHFDDDLNNQLSLHIIRSRLRDVSFFNCNFSNTIICVAESNITEIFIDNVKFPSDEKIFDISASAEYEVDTNSYQKSNLHIISQLERVYVNNGVIKNDKRLDNKQRPNPFFLLFRRVIHFLAGKKEN